VRAGSIQGQTLGASVALAAAVMIVAAMSGRASLGAGLGIGLILGSFNGFIIQALLERRAPMLATSVLRLGFFSVLALVAARFAGGSVWPVVIGIGLAQLVMVGIGVRRGLRA
jgi:hypothetical protein